MIRSFKYRIYPTPKQVVFIEQSFGICRYIYNWALNEKIKAYQNEKKQLKCFDLIKALTTLKKEDDKQWLRIANITSLQQSILNLDRAFMFFYRNGCGFPKFKSKRKSAPSCKFIMGVKFNFDKKQIKIPKCGWVKFSCDRIFTGKIGTLTITKSPTEKYYASIVIDTGTPIPKKPEIKDTTSVGIDVGIKTLATLSNGVTYDNMRFLENNEKRLKVLQRRLCKKQKGSNRRNEARLKVARQYEKIRNLRTNYLHQVTSKIIAENQSIIIEDLNVGGMLKNHCLAKSISSVAWAEFFRMLEYKSEWYGRNLIRIGRFEPSSKMCYCGAINSGLKLSDREWVCPECGSINDRDLLAAQNIKKFGLQKQNLIGYSPAVGGEGDVELSPVGGAGKRQCIEVSLN